MAQSFAPFYNALRRDGEGEHGYNAFSNHSLARLGENQRLPKVQSAEFGKRYGGFDVWLRLHCDSIWRGV